MELGLDKIQKTPFFFILGRPRSGTTLLSTVLDAHPNICIPYESAIIQSFYDDLVEQRKFSSWHIEKEKLLANILKCDGNCTFQQLIKLVYLQFNSIYKKDEIQLVGDKNPIYSFYGKQLMKVFPNARIVHIVRDHRDNIASIKKVDFEAPITALLAHRWKLANREILKLKIQFPKQYYLLKYEDLVLKPEEVLNELCNFLGIAYTNQMLDFYTEKEEQLKRFSEKDINTYHSSLYNPIDSSKIGNWKTSMTKYQIKLADQIASPIAETLGYRKEYKQSFVLLLISLHWILYSHFSIFVRKVMDLMPFRIKMYFRNKGPVLAYVLYKMLKR